MRRLILAGALLAACHDVPTVPPTATSLEVVSGDHQSGVPGYLLANQISVRLLDEHGAPVAGDTLVFTTDDPRAYVGPVAGSDIAPQLSASAVTDADGVASVPWRLGQGLGTQTVTVRAKTNPPVAAATISATSSSSQVRSIQSFALEFVTESHPHFCAIDLQYRLGCWLGPRVDGPVIPTHVAPIAAPVQFTQVTIGNFGLPRHGCALTTTGRVWCFEVDDSAAITGLAELAGGYPALATIGGETANGSAMSYCGLTADGQAWCWGDNSTGQVGDGTHVDRAGPVPVATFARFAQVDVGGNHTCAVTATGTAWCWGRNPNSETGQPASPDVAVPSPVAASESFTQVVALDEFLQSSCGITVDRKAYCWGAVDEVSPSFGVNMSVVPLAFPLGTSSPVVAVADISSSVTLLTPLPSELATGFSYFPGQLPTVVRDISSKHAVFYVCGTAVAGAGALCQWLYVSDIGPFNLPKVIGVPLD